MKPYLSLLLLTLLPAPAGAMPFDAGAPALLPIPSLPYLDTVAQEGAMPALIGAAVPERLASARGRNDPTPSAALDAVVANNSATDVVTGANIITNGSFANMSGLPVVIQNSGANVLIQNATVINLQLR